MSRERPVGGVETLEAALHLGETRTEIATLQRANALSGILAAQGNRPAWGLSGAECDPLTRDVREGSDVG